MIGIEYINKAKIIDTSVAFSSGPAAGAYSVKKQKPDALSVSVGTLAPSEVATVSLIVDAEGNEPPSVAVKSDKTIGSASPIIRPSNEKSTEIATTSTLLSFLMPIAITGQVFLIRFFKNALGGTRSINNVAFMYIHRGLCAEAKPLLQQDISKRGATSYELANYGLCLGLDGDYDKAEVNLAAAEFYTSGAGIKALVLFNRGIIAHKRGDVVAARTFFQEALRLSRRRIIKYAKFSLLMTDIFNKDPDAKKLFNI